MMMQYMVIFRSNCCCCCVFPLLLSPTSAWLQIRGVSPSHYRVHACIHSVSRICAVVLSPFPVHRFATVNGPLESAGLSMSPHVASQRVYLAGLLCSGDIS